MSASPQFISTPRIGAASVSTANTGRDGSGTIATVFTAHATNGSKIEEIVVKSTGDPADCTVIIFLHDGSNFWAYDEYDIGNPAAGSATVGSYRLSTVYDNLVLPAGWSLRASITVAPTAGVVNVIAKGGDF